MQKEFSYPLIVADMPLNEQHYHMTANAENLIFLAEVLQIPEVKSLDADFRLKLNHNTDILSITGHIKAEIMQKSVISLETFSTNYDFDFQTEYDVKATLASQKEEGDDWDKDMPEVVIGGNIDLGDIAIEQIALRLDDYPRKEGEVFSFVSEFDEEDDVKNNPFAILTKLKK